MTKPRIILANLTNLTAAPQASYAPPIGLYALANLNPEAIKVMDSAAHPLDETLATMGTNTSHIFCMLAQDSDTEQVSSYCQTIKHHFPKIKIGVNLETNNFKSFSDFREKASGAQAIMRILAGQAYDGHLSESEKEEPLALPVTPLADKGYHTAPEKTLCNRTLELFKPWQGLQERGPAIMPTPHMSWFQTLVPWVRESGFGGLHFRPLDLDEQQILELLTVLEGYHGRVALALSERVELPAKLLEQGLVRQLWYYNPSCGEHLAVRFKQLQNTHCAPCLSISKAFVDSPCIELLKGAERLAIEDEELWSGKELKKVLKGFWLRDFRFLKRLGGLKSAAELIAFMRSTYKALDTLLERKEKCQ
jgi:hypothetical protein